MHIYLKETGKILKSAPALKEGLNVLGKVHGVAAPDFELQPVSSAADMQDLSPSRIDAAGPLVYVQGGKVLWAAPDITATQDLFWVRTPQGNYVLGDDLFQVSKEFSSLHSSRDVILYFVRHGFLPPGDTLFEEIKRIRVGTKLVFGKGVVKEEDTWHERETKPRTYEAFKRGMRSVFETYPFADHAGVALSAGSDSGLVTALACVRYGKNPLAITMMNPHQRLKINDIDAANVQRITRYLGLRHAIVDFDFNAEHAAALKPIARAMPLAAHLSVHHVRIAEEAQKHGLVQLWHGQSADSVYNLGPTQKSWGGPLRRFYLAKEYWQGFPDIHGNKLMGRAMRVLGMLGPYAWRRVHRQDLRQPVSFQELVEAFAQAQGTPPFPKKEQASLPAFAEKRTTSQAREQFFAWKAQSFLTGRDPRIRYVMGKRFGFEVVHPYTAANMLQFFRGLETDLRDVFFPKRFIYRYLRELLGKKAYGELYVNQAKRLADDSPASWAQWQKNVINNTVFGKEVSEIAHREAARLNLRPEHDWNPLDIQHALGLVWLQHVRDETEKAGISFCVV